MANANTADFLGGSAMPIAKAKIYAPGEEPNPKNPGGVSNNELKRQRKASEIKQLEVKRAKDLAAAKKEQGRKLVAAREAEYERRGGFWGIALEDAKVLGPVALKAAGTAAAVVATGGAAAGAIGLTAAAGVTAAATTASKVIDAVDTGQKVVSSLKKGDVAGLAGAAKDGLAEAGIKTPPVPSAAKMGKEAVASLSLPKISASAAKKELAAAKKTVTAAVAAPKTAAKTVTAAAAKIAPPKAAPAKVLASAANVFKPAAAVTTAAKKAGKKLEDELSAIDKQRLATIPGAKIVVQKNGKVTVQTPAASTAAAAMFKPNLTNTPHFVAAVVRPTTPASASVTIKPPPAGSKPPAMTINRPPTPSPSVGSTIATAAPSSAPPVIKPPPAAVSDAPSSGPMLEGYLVKLNGTVEPRGRYRAA